jgi:nucleoside-diphosphate-sugar epimerase
MAETWLITGATGIVGSELVRALVRAPDAPALKLLARGDLVPKKRWLSEWVGAPVELLAGDVTQPIDGAGLDDVTAIVHAAAATDFEQPADEADRQNLIGTRNVLELARRLPRCQRIGLVSTAYVAGARRGRIGEDDLDLTVRFTSEYERSKAMAEAEARRSGLPVAIYRLGIVVGRRSDGHIARMTTVYPVWRLVYQGMVPMVPGDPDQPLDLAPVDFVAEAIVHLMRHFSPTTYHVCAGPERSFTLGELFPALLEAIVAAEPSWARHGYLAPAAVPPEAYQTFVDSVDLVANPRLQMIARIVRSFTRPLEAPKWFDTTRFASALEGSGLELQHARAWLGTLVAHALAVRFRARRWEAQLDG